VVSGERAARIKIGKFVPRRIVARVCFPEAVEYGRLPEVIRKEQDEREE